MSTNNQKQKGTGRKAAATQYKASRTWEKNRKRKLERTLKKQPTNEQVKMALKDINYRRKTPGKPVWSHSMISTAKLFKEFCGRVDFDIFSPDEKKRGAALQARGIYSELPVSKKKAHTGREPGMFSIEARLINGRKGLTWSS